MLLSCKKRRNPHQVPAGARFKAPSAALKFGGIRRMGFKLSISILVFGALICTSALAQGPKNVDIEPEFPGDDLSGSQIKEEVGWGAYDDVNDSSLSFRNESLFIIRKDTGMSPNVPGQGVRTPAIVLGRTAVPLAAGSWALTLNDVDKSYLKLDLYQTGDAVFGSGELAENGAIIPVTAGGSVLGDRLALFVVPAGSQNMYRFSLTIQPGSLNGDYIFTAPGASQPGVAFGSLLSPQIPQAAGQPAQMPQAAQMNQTPPAAMPAA